MQSGTTSPATLPMVRDPVCGMTVDPRSAKASALYQGQTYFFCCGGCRDKFLAAPQTYLSKSQLRPASASPTQAGLWTCPMDPEIVRDKPGSCPICGMALEPMTATEESGENPELADMRRRLWVGAVLSVPLLVLAMGADMIPIPSSASRWLQLACAAPIVLWAGAPFFAKGWASLLNRRLNMFSLISLGTGVAFAYSLVAVALPHLFPPSFNDADGSLPLYFEASGVIVTLVLIGQVLELRARGLANGAIRALLDLAPQQARVIRPDGREEDIPLAAIQIDDVLRVRPGEKIPCDGLILEGASVVDESMMTGEANPIAKVAGDPLTGATLNRDGALTMRAIRVGEATLLAQIVRMVAAAQRSRAPIQSLADRISGWFVPAVILAAVVTFIAWSVLAPEHLIGFALRNAIAVLIVACPCALGLATPMSIMVATGRGARAGVLIKDAKALQTMEAVDTLAIDKTGTLTEGKPRLVAMSVAPGWDEDSVLGAAASLERASEHPIAAAIVAGALARKIALSPAADTQAVPGQGIVGAVENRRVIVGSAALMAANAVDVGALANQAAAIGAEGNSTMFIAIDARAAGLIAVADPVKADAAETVKALSAEKIRVVMVSGDNRAAAESVGRAVGITDIEAEMLPDQKAQLVSKLQAGGHKVAMAGDGINDAPALAQADVGIAMGTGSDIALESGWITLVGGDLRGILRARRLSRATMRNIRQNLGFAFVFNILAIPIAAGALYPATGLLLNPMIASAAMSMSSLLVVGNALRLRSLPL